MALEWALPRTRRASGAATGNRNQRGGLKMLAGQILAVILFPGDALSARSVRTSSMRALTSGDEMLFSLAPYRWASRASTKADKALSSTARCAPEGGAGLRNAVNPSPESPRDSDDEEPGSAVESPDSSVPPLFLPASTSSLNRSVRLGSRL